MKEVLTTTAQTGNTLRIEADLTLPHRIKIVIENEDEPGAMLAIELSKAEARAVAAFIESAVAHQKYS